MLKAIHLENFKAFGEKTTIPLAPITLIYGQNSAGKSSILQALHLLKQTRESRDLDALLLPRAEKGIVDLGSFQDLLFDHESDRELCIRLDTDLDSLTGPQNGSHLEDTGVEFRFSRPSPDDEIALAGVNFYGLGSDRPIACFSGVRELDEQSRVFGFPRRSGGEEGTVRAIGCSYLSKDKRLWISVFEQLKENKETILKSLDRMAKERHAPTLFDEDEEIVDEREKQLLEEAINFIKHGPEWDNFIERYTSTLCQELYPLNGFLPRMRNSLSFGGFNLPELRRLRLNLRRTQWLPRLVDCQGLSVEKHLDMIFPLGPYRRPPERWYIFSGTCPSDVGYRGEQLPDLLLRRASIRRETNQWLERLGVGYKIAVKPIGSRRKDLYEIELEDSFRNKPVKVGLADVGFGMSQILPLIVQSLASQNRIITVEQPEVHIHPKLQADLGDLIASAISNPQRNQFIIETHSEHLVLRVQKLIRTGSLSPEEVSVLYVSRGKEGSSVQRLRLDEKGRFIDAWPGGFFPERRRELRG